VTAYRYTTPILDELAFARMSIATDDPNPMHFNHQAAVRAGLPGVIGSGLFVMGLLDKAARSVAGDHSGYKFDIQMRGPVLPGRALDISVVDEQDGLSVQVNDSAGGVVAKGRLHY
jgi:acyl dehydratase